MNKTLLAGAIGLVIMAGSALAETPKKYTCVEFEDQPVVVSGTVSRTERGFALKLDHPICTRDIPPGGDQTETIRGDASLEEVILTNEEGHKPATFERFAGKHVIAKGRVVLPSDWKGEGRGFRVMGMEPEPSFTHAPVDAPTLYTAAEGKPAANLPDVRGRFYEHDPDLKDETVEIHPDCTLVRRYSGVPNITEYLDFRRVSGRIEERPTAYDERGGFFLVFGKGFWCSIMDGKRTCPEKIEVRLYPEWRDLQWKALTAAARRCAHKELTIMDVW